MKRTQTDIAMAGLFLAVVLFLVLNISMGSVGIPVSSVFKILCGYEENEIWRNIIFKLRLPQSLTAIVAGAGLATSGLLMQTVFHNPLAGPSVLGISSGASLGVAFVVLLSGTFGGVALSQMGAIGEVATTIAAVAGSLIVLVLIAWTARKVRGNVTLLIIGVMIGYIANAIIGVLKFFSVEEDIRAYVIWGLGSFARVSGGQTMTFVLIMICLLPLCLFFSKTLNLMLLGDYYAQNLGLNIRRARLSVIVASGILVAVVTAYCGPIVFLGLAVPHLCRGIFRTSDHRILLPGCMLTGAWLALACNLIARLPWMDGALPVNSVTALIGAPVVMWVLFNRRKSRI